jgi:hypothetical protein
MKRILQIGLLLIILLAQLALFDMVIPVQASGCREEIKSGCQSPCECGGGWYCSGYENVIFYFRVPVIHTCVKQQVVECPYWCLCCPCGTPDKCILPGGTCN